MKFREIVSKDIQLKGRCKIIVEENGITSIHYDDQNMIVNVAKKILAHLLAEAPSDYALATLELGTGGHAPGDILTPVDPELTDIALETSEFSKAISTFEYLPVSVDSTVKFTTVIERTEANGTGTVAYTEAGMFTTASDMFCRRTFPALVKTNNRKITIEWSIIF